MVTEGAQQRAQRLRHAKRIWARWRPQARLSRGRSIRSELSFSSIEEIAPELRFGTGVQAIEISERIVSLGALAGIPFGAEIPGLRIGDVSVRARGRLHDDQARALASVAEDRDIGDLHFLDFDVHAVACRMDGRQLESWPYVDANPLEEELARILETYCVTIDRIWDHFGGRNRAGFEAMALWLMRNDLGGKSNAFLAVFAADRYGDKTLARRFLDDLRTHWDRKMREGPDWPLVQEMGRKSLEAILLARQMIC